MSCIQYKMGEFGLSGLTYQLTVNQFVRWGLTCVDQCGSFYCKTQAFIKALVSVPDIPKLPYQPHSHNPPPFCIQAD